MANVKLCFFFHIPKNETGSHRGEPTIGWWAFHWPLNALLASLSAGLFVSWDTHHNNTSTLDMFKSPTGVRNSWNSFAAPPIWPTRISKGFYETLIFLDFESRIHQSTDSTKNNSTPQRSFSSSFPSQIAGLQMQGFCLEAVPWYYCVEVCMSKI